jgi:hypothetical protein
MSDNNLDLDLDFDFSEDMPDDTHQIDLNTPLIDFVNPNKVDNRVLLPQKDVFETRSPFDIHYPSNDPETMNLLRKHHNVQAKEYYYYKKSQNPEAYNNYIQKKREKNKANYKSKAKKTKSSITKGGKRNKTFRKKRNCKK